MRKYLGTKVINLNYKQIKFGECFWTLFIVLSLKTLCFEK
jgi:hypothetical protein